MKSKFIPYWVGGVIPFRSHYMRFSSEGGGYTVDGIKSSEQTIESKRCSRWLKLGERTHTHTGPPD